MRLLLNLLAETHGSSTSLRVLALFDPEFNTELKIPEIDLGQKVNGKTFFKKKYIFLHCYKIKRAFSGSFKKKMKFQEKIANSSPTMKKMIF